MSERWKIGTGRTCRVDMDQTSTPFRVHVMLAVWRLDDDKVKVTGILTVGQEQRPIKQMNRTTCHHDCVRAKSNDSGGARKPFLLVGFATKMSVRQHGDAGIDG